MLLNPYFGGSVERWILTILDALTRQCGNLLWIDRKGSASRYAPDLIEFV